MIKQGIVNDSILEKKFKILRTSIMLGNIRNRDEMLSTYEETAREIDKIRRGVYEELLASKMYTTTTLEEERDRLKDLTQFTENRIKERNDFIDDYIKVTSNFLDNLPRVSNEEELSSYKIRLDNINEYLTNCSEIEKLNIKLNEKREELEEKYENKASNDIINAKLEDELIDEFNKLITDDEYYSSLNYTDIDNELLKVDNNLDDKKDVMNTFISSYDALKNAGISSAEKEEYLSYVNDARKDYYNELEKKYMLNIYKLVLDKENDYDLLYQKRLQISNILKDRLDKRHELEITSRDNLEYFSDICNEQFSIIKSQKFNIESIDKLILEISDCENKLEELDRANNRSDIISLLDEYSVDRPKIEKVEMPLPKEIHDEVFRTSEVEGKETKPGNMVVKISEPVKINVKNATDTAKLVMKKVVIVLEPKRFNNKKDKLKEAEKELEEVRQKENIVQEEKNVEKQHEDFPSYDLKDKKDDLVEKVEEAKHDDLFDNGETFVTLDASNDTDDTFDDVFINTPSNSDISINLDTKEVGEGVKDTFTTNEVKINVPEGEMVSIPTEIFIEESPKEKEPDLFSQTDPFLDDNQFEIDNSSNREEIVSNMPAIGNIGTVRPTSMLSKIEEATHENDDIILPTMGLTNNDETNVPIVSENYIS